MLDELIDVASMSDEDVRLAFRLMRADFEAGRTDSPEYRAFAAHYGEDLLAVLLGGNLSATA